MRKKLLLLISVLLVSFIFLSLQSPGKDKTSNRKARQDKNKIDKILDVSLNIICNCPVCQGETLYLWTYNSTTINAKHTWRGPNGFFSNSRNVVIPKVTKKAEGWYFLTAEHEDYKYKDSIYVTIKGSLPVEIINMGPHPACEGDHVRLICANDKAAFWSTGEYGNEILVNKSGKYWAHASDNEGCSSDDTIDVVINPRPTVDIEPDGPTEFCQGDSVVLSVKPFDMVNTYKWSTNKYGKSITVKKEGEYSVVVTNRYGCKDTAWINVNVNGIKAEILGSDYLCIGDSAYLKAYPSGEGYSILWSTGDTTEQIIVGQPGLYSVIISSSQDCRDTAYINLEQVKKTEAGIKINGPAYFCMGDSIKLMAEPKDSTIKYKWSNGSEEDNITVNKAGTYSLVITDSLGCRDTAGVTVLNYPPVDVSIVSDGFVICKGGSATLSTDKEFTSYKWSTGETTRSITVSEGGKYRVSVTDTNGCRGSDTAEVTIVLPPVAGVEASGPTTFCEGDSVILKAMPQDSSLRYFWSTGERTSRITARKTGRYYVVVSNSNNCMDTSFADVNVIPVPVVTIDPQVKYLCPGESAVLRVVEDYPEYLWSTGERTREITVTQEGAYSVSVTNGQDCTGRDTAEIKQYEINISGLDSNVEMDTVCTGEESIRKLTVRNQGRSDIKLDISKSTGAGGALSYGTEPKAPLVLKQGEEAGLVISFRPGDARLYADTLAVRVIEPCQKEYAINIKGAGKAVTYIWFPDTTGTIGDKNYMIPLGIKLKCGASVPSENKFSISAGFYNGVYAADRITNHNLAENNIDDYSNIIRIDGQASIEDRNETVLTSVCGSLLFGSQRYTPLKILDFAWDNPLIIPEKKDGSLEINDFCQQRLSHIRIMDVLKLSAAPNPAGNNTEIKISGNYKGKIFLNLVSVHGLILFSSEYEKKEKYGITDILDLKNFSSGLYQLRVSAGGESEVMTLVICK